MEKYREIKINLEGIKDRNNQINNNISSLNNFYSYLGMTEYIEDINKYIIQSQNYLIDRIDECLYNLEANKDNIQNKYYERICENMSTCNMYQITAFNESEISLDVVKNMNNNSTVTISKQEEKIDSFSSFIVQTNAKLMDILDDNISMLKINEKELNEQNNKNQEITEEIEI